MPREQLVRTWLENILHPPLEITAAGTMRNLSSPLTGEDYKYLSSPSMGEDYKYLSSPSMGED